MLSQIAKTYKHSLDASVKKVTNYTVKEKYEYVGDLTKLIKHLADDQSTDAAIIAKFKKRISGIYEETLNEMRVNKKAS